MKDQKYDTIFSDGGEEDGDDDDESAEGEEAENSEAAENGEKEKNGEDYVNSHTDKELFESEVVIDDHIKATKVFKARAAMYTEKYVRENFEGKTDQEILTSSKNSPDVVKKSTPFKEKLRHLTKKDKSEKLGMELLKETLEALKVWRWLYGEGTEEDISGECYKLGVRCARAGSELQRGERGDRDEEKIDEWGAEVTGGPSKGNKTGVPTWGEADCTAALGGHHSA